MKQNCDRTIFFACIFLLAFMFPPPPAQAGQTIIINGNITAATNPGGNVYGNGHGPTGYGNLGGSPTVNTLLDPNNNTIIVNGGTIGGWVSNSDIIPGASNGSVTVTGNTVIFNSGEVRNQEIFGGYGNARGSDPANSVAVAGNNVIIQGDAFVGDTLGGYGEIGDHIDNPTEGAGSVRVTGNSVTVRGNAHIELGATPWLYSEGLVGGGVAYVFGDGSAIVEGNRVTIEGGARVESHVYGGVAQVDGVGAYSIRDNAVTITGGIVTNQVYGGYGVAESSVNDYVHGSVTNNTVTVSGNTAVVADDIHGGYAYFWDNNVRGDASVIHNTVAISGNPDISASTLYGGLVEYGFGNPTPNQTQDDFTGNTLIANTLDRAVTGMQNFEYMNFFLPETVASGDKVFIASGKVVLSEHDNPASPGRLPTVNVGVDGRRAPLNAGDHVVLIDTTAGGGNLMRDSVNDKSLGMHGVTLQYDFDIWRGDTALGTTRALGENDVTGHQLVASLSRAPRAAPGSDAISKGSLIDASMLLNQGADLAAEQGMTQALCAARCLRGVNVFTALSGGMARYDAGSHVDMFSASVLTGIAKGMTAANNCLTLGAFFEYGYGSYDADKPASSLPSAGGGGSNYSLGGGLLGRMQFAGADSGQFYAEASLRAGTIQGSHNTGLRDMIGREATYDSSTGYYGAHLGAGRVWRGGFGGACVDLGAKYFWTRRNSDSATLSTGETVDFRSLDSHRARVAARFSRETDKEYSPYVGVAYEYEFAAKARSRVAGYDLNPSSLRGGTAIVEAGLAIKPSANLPLSADLRAHGYLGKRTGMGASVRVGIEF